MKINVLSDLHLEFANMVHDVPDDVDLVILAGDIATGMDGVEWAASLAEHNYVPVIYVPGNHEFYKGQLFPDHYEYMREYCEPFINLHFLQNDSIVINGVRFIGSCLWTDFNFTGNQPRSMLVAPSYMNDYRVTYEKQGDRETFLTPKTVLDDHMSSMLYLATELAKPFDGETVVITHHGVGENSIHPRFKTSMGNEYFASRLENFISKHQPKYWIHGHTHCQIDYMIGNTRVIANPRGYVRRYISYSAPYQDFEDVENKEFRKDFTIEV